MTSQEYRVGLVFVVLCFVVFNFIVFPSYRFQKWTCSNDSEFCRTIGEFTVLEFMHGKGTTVVTTVSGIFYLDVKERVFEKILADGDLILKTKSDRFVLRKPSGDHEFSLLNCCYFIDTIECE